MKRNKKSPSRALRAKQAQVLKRILLQIRPHMPLVLLSLALAAVSVILTLYIPILIGRGVDAIISRGNVDFSALSHILITIVVCIIFTAVFQWFMGHINNKITYSIIKDMRVRAFDHLHELPLSYVDAHSQGDLLSRIVTDIETFSDGLLMGFTQLFTGILTILCTIFFMFTLNPWITIIVIVLSPLSFMIAGFVSVHSYSMFQKQSESRGELTGFTNEMLANQKIVSAFLHESASESTFDKINDKLAVHSEKATFYSSLTNPSTRLMYNIIYAGVTIAGALMCFPSLGAALTIGKLTSFLSYTNQYTKPFNEITSVLTEFQNSIASAARVYEYLDEAPETPDTDRTTSMPVVSGDVTFENVAFSYTKNKPFIEDLNISADAGTKVALVGPTGCGKTTLINLLMRFYDVDQGSIRLDGTDIRDVTRSSLRDNYAMVLQDTWLRSGTIRDNISYGWPDASDEEIIAAAKAAHAHSFIIQLPKGYDTVIGENGGELSQGQKQLLCISRVMLHLPQILILDEATSSIDTLTEIRVQKAFDEMMKGRTSFIVAHRLSTIRSADIILVMRNGKIIERGSHKELLSMNGFYKELYDTQFNLVGESPD